jgi:hypothetical protein
MITKAQAFKLCQILYNNRIHAHAKIIDKSFYFVVYNVNGINYEVMSTSYNFVLNDVSSTLGKKICH